jgi:hypothetical protein
MFKVTDNKNKDYGTVETIELAWELITNYLKQINFKSYYCRQIELGSGKLWIDYGSHTHFFYIEIICDLSNTSLGE